MILRMVLSSYLVEVAVEVVASYLIVGRLKATERVNFFDCQTNFNFFALQRENARP